jgi:hypothetical protein
MKHRQWREQWSTVRDTTIDMHADPLKTWSSFSDIPLIIVTRETSCEDDISVLRGPYFDAVEPSRATTSVRHIVILHPRKLSSPAVRLCRHQQILVIGRAMRKVKRKINLLVWAPRDFIIVALSKASDDCRPLRQYGATQDRDNNDENVSAGKQVSG